jgi:hypothetical protein
LRENPVGAWEVAGVTVRIAFEVVLVIRLGCPEIPDRFDLGYHLAGPEAGGIDVVDGVERDLPLAWNS